MLSNSFKYIFLIYLDIAVTTVRTSLTDNGQLTRVVSSHNINTRGRDVMGTEVANKRDVNRQIGQSEGI